MNRISYLSKLIKLAAQDELKAWQAVKAEVESDQLPEGIIDVAAIQESATAAQNLMAKAKEAKSAADSMSEEEKKEAEAAIKDPQFQGVIQSAISAGPKAAIASSIIDQLLVKSASKYIAEEDAIQIVKEINLYNRLNGLEVKIASRSDFSRILFEKEAAFEKMCQDGEFLSESNFFKISCKYSDGMTKQATEGTSLWQGVKNMGSKALELGGKGLGYVGTGLKYGFKFLGTIMPFVGVLWAAKDAYESYENVNKSLEGLKSHFSDLGNEDSLVDPKYIGGLISKFGNDPEKLLRVAQLNKVAEFYKKNWWNQWYSVLWFISDLIFSVGVIAALVGSGGTAAGVGAVIMAPLEIMTEQILGKKAVWLAGKAGLGSLAGSLATSLFGVGLGDYETNKKSISTLADTKIQSLSTSSETSSSGEGAEGGISDEEAFKAVEQLGQYLGKR